ncbi:winged helix-turn-helix transcriptional regulator [Streptomyces luteolus]|uniref:Helix-turn-helix domain-containing protein n=1 Tax=Streptomyces luteolus TaxID=3043615 RepID=A0ABT6T3V2_9ACTN|nr:helix-turn-helix domain-containing protein [Streptomyces sp. B-S-A12]MDI3422095.1 helix-turn-helix domain-containing protein [Streptomyces sp. B-S-A12]
MKESPTTTDGTVFDSDCPVRDILSHIATRWGLLILAALGERPLRFFELANRVGGISDKMLAQTLRLLTRDGLISRTVEPTNPPRVTYALTELGQDISAPMRRLMERIQARTPDVLAAQQAHDATAESSGVPRSRTP